MSHPQQRFFQILLPVVVLGGAIGVAIALVKFGQKVEPAPPAVKPPVVAVVTVAPEDHQLVLHSQGVVTARTEIDLAAEVTGRVVRIAPAFANGGFFADGDELVTIEPRDYELAVKQAEAQLAQAKVRLTREEAEAEVAVKEWQRLGEGKPSPLLLREPQLAEARAMVSSAEAMLEQARLNLSRCHVKAPFAGRVDRKSVDVGQIVAAGVPLARIYAVDFAEVRLPLPEDQLAYVDLPLDFREEDGRPGPIVRLTAEFAGETHTWEGRVVRTEGRIDTRTRMVYAVARVEHPYGRQEGSTRPPLAVGMYVQAEVLGHELSHVFVLPREAVRDNGTVWRFEDGALHERPVETVRLTRDSGIVTSGLTPGDQVCVSRISTFADGMKVRVETQAE